MDAIWAKDPNLLGDFLTESREYIQDAEAALLSLETEPDDMDSIDTYYPSSF